MNNTFLRWLLDVEAIPADAQSIQFVWERPWPAWFWALLILVAALFAAWTYSRLAGNRRARIILAAVRFAAIIFVLALLSGPTLQVPRFIEEQDWVLLLADRSESMKIADADSGGVRISRDEQLRRALDANQPAWSTLAANRRAVWLGFDAGAYDLAGVTSDPADSTAIQINPPPPTGQQTRLNTAIEQALQRAAARPLSGVVIFSDGQTIDPPTRALVRRLQADAVEVFVVPLGSSDPIGDFALGRVDAPRRAFVRDKVPIAVELDRLGEAVRESGATVKLLDQATGEELDRVRLDAGDSTTSVTLTAQPEVAGEATWQVVIESDRPDLIPENNLKTLAIELIDRPLRVLYIEGYPRWEYRYVKNLLIREKTLTSSVMLISADRDFAQEGNEPITRLPRSPEEFADYDVIVIGDVPASFFAPSQLDMIRDHVATRGAGLLWIAGERSTPSTYAGSVLADLLPMRGSLELSPIGVPVHMTPTPLAERLGVLRLSQHDEIGWPQSLSDERYTWSRLFYAQRIEPGRLKPTAETLATTTQSFAGSPLPLVVHMRYGAGRIVYAATDEIWRWRFGQGELLPEQFWLQVVRMLGRESLIGGSDPAVLEVQPRRLAVGQPMRIQLRLVDGQLAQEGRAAVGAILETTDGQSIAEIELRREEGVEERYAATYLPDIAGSLHVRLRDPSLTRLNLTAPVEVFRPDDELRRPETDHTLLATLAAETGGRVLTAADLPNLPDILRNRAVRTPNPLMESIWDTPLAFALVLLLLAAEWIGRKILRLA